MDISALTSISAADATSQLAGIREPVRSDRTLTPSQLRNASPEVQRKQVAQQFEAIMVRQLLGKTITSMVGDSKDASTSVFGDLLTDSFAQQLTRGGGLGLATLLEQQLTPRSERAAHLHLSSAPTASGAAAATSAPPNVAATPAAHS